MVAATVDAVYADGYRDPGDIATDDAGTSKQAYELKAPATDTTPGESRG
jgi:hypothetical protein